MADSFHVGSSGGTAESLGEALVHLRAINATLNAILQRLPDSAAPLAEAVDGEQ